MTVLLTMPLINLGLSVKTDKELSNEHYFLSNYG